MCVATQVAWESTMALAASARKAGISSWLSSDSTIFGASIIVVSSWPCSAKEHPQPTQHPALAGITAQKSHSDSLCEARWSPSLSVVASDKSASVSYSMHQKLHVSRLC